jgi:hypothetical protein
LLHEGVWIRNRMFWDTLTSNSGRRFTNYYNTVVSSVTFITTTLGNGFQQWKFLCSLACVLTGCRPTHTNLLLFCLLKILFIEYSDSKSKLCNDRRSVLVFRRLRVCWCGEPSLTRGRVCSLQLFRGLWKNVKTVTVIIDGKKTETVNLFRYLERIQETSVTRVDMNLLEYIQKCDQWNGATVRHIRKMQLRKISSPSSTRRHGWLRYYATSRKVADIDHSIFQLTEFYQPHYCPGVNSAFNGDEYQESSWG